MRRLNARLRSKDALRVNRFNEAEKTSFYILVASRRLQYSAEATSKPARESRRGSN